MRSVFVRPRGGFNDSLCEIVKCMLYAIKYSRRLIIDTSKSSLHDDLGRYFDTRSGIENVDFFVLGKRRFKAESIFPPELAASFPNYAVVYDRVTSQCRHADTGVSISFDFYKDYEQELLVHEQHRLGKMASPIFFNFFWFKDEILKEINRRLQKVPSSYASVHIRNTDYTTDYKAFLDAVLKQAKAPVLICSDSREVLDYAREKFAGKTFILSNFSNDGNVPLHWNPVPNQFELNLQMLIDLVGMAKSEFIHFRNVNEVSHASGFSLLAKALSESKRFRELIG